MLKPTLKAFIHESKGLLESHAHASRQSSAQAFEKSLFCRASLKKIITLHIL